MKPLGKDMLSLLIAVIAAVLLLWGSDALTYRLIQRSPITYTTAMTSLLPTNGVQVVALVALILIVIVLCAVLSF